MAFNPLDFQAFVDALRGDDDEATAMAAFKATADEQLAKSCIWPEQEYNDDLALASLIQEKLVALGTAAVANAYGTIIPEIVGLTLQYLESLAHGNEDENGKTDSQSEQQSSEENPTGA